MLKIYKVKGMRGHFYYREEPPDIWYYDKFGREPRLGDYFVYAIPDSQGIYHLHIGCIYLSNWWVIRDIFDKIVVAKRVLYYAKVKHNRFRLPGEKKVEEISNGLSIYSPFYDLSKVRSMGGIILLNSEIGDPRVSPHLL